jgi:membrane-associated protease RseP (regulator of RpoE activity)
MVAAHPMASAFMVSEASDSERIEALEQQIEMLSSRIKQLEQNAIAAKRDETVQRGAPATGQATPAGSPVSSSSQALTTKNLVDAGIDEAIAADIVRRKNEIELQKLELRDRATREGFLGTRRYRTELNTLQQRDFSLRDELGDAAYDRYLFTTGQSNRVNIASVMQGSAADQAGLKPGDVILNYADKQLFNWNELQKATTLGVRGEYVDVTVMRNGQVINLWLPRGPLGVRLSSARLQP